LVWLTNCRVVSSSSAILEVDKPLLIKDQTVFCLWLNGDAKVQDTILKAPCK
jgi:hypothetical protein